VPLHKKHLNCPFQPVPLQEEHFIPLSHFESSSILCREFVANVKPTEATMAAAAMRMYFFITMLFVGSVCLLVDETGMPRLAGRQSTSRRPTA
jgi:hypothetical protein